MRPWDATKRCASSVSDISSENSATGLPCSIEAFSAMFVTRAELLRRVPVADPVPLEDGADELAEYRVYRPAAAREFEVEKLGAGEFRVSGDVVERLIARHDMENEEALAHVERHLHRLGALEHAGFVPGDDVEIGGIVFELDPGAPL